MTINPIETLLPSNSPLVPIYTLLAHDMSKIRAVSSQDHFLKSKDAILRASEGLTKRALILGAGGANDLPLEELAKRFDRIILVDIDPRPTKDAVKKLPQRFRKKFQIKQSDLTGFFKTLDQEVKKKFRLNCSEKEFLEEVLRLSSRTRKKELIYQKLRPSFICSSLLCSQLTTGILEALNKHSQRLFQKRFSELFEKKEGFIHFVIQFQIRHIEELHRLVTPGGKVYFADHFSAIDVTEVIFGRRARVGTLTLRNYSGTEQVQEAFRKLFTTISKQTWLWPVSLNTQTVRVCEITSLILIPKLHSAPSSTQVNLP